jgi:hypothetical protein
VTNMLKLLSDRTHPLNRHRQNKLHFLQPI